MSVLSRIEKWPRDSGKSVSRRPRVCHKGTKMRYVHTGELLKKVLSFE